MNLKKAIRLPDYRELAEKLGAGLEIPAGSLPGGFHIELENNTCALIDGCIGVLEYRDDCVKLNLGRLVVRISGSRLTITEMQDNRASVNGNIAAMDFLN